MANAMNGVAANFVPLALDLDVPKTTPAQKWLAIGLVVLFFLVLTVLAYRLQYIQLSGPQKRHKSALRGQREDTDPRTVRISRDEDLSDVADRIRDLIRDDDFDGIEDRMTLREATDRVITQWSEQFAGIPRYVTYGVLESATVLLLGSMAVVSSETWKKLLNSQPDYPDPTIIFEWTGGAVEQGTQALFEFPFLDFIWNLTFAYSILLIEWLYNHWYITGTLLFVGTFAVFLLDYRSEEVTERKIYHFRPFDYLKFVATALTIWLAGVIPSEIGDAVGFGTLGDVIGFLFAVIVFAYGLRLAYRGLRVRLHSMGATAGDSASGGTSSLPTRRRDKAMRQLIASYLMMWKAWAFFAVLLIPIIAMYAVYLLISGKLFTLVGYLFGASLDVKVLVVALVMAIVLPLLYIARTEWGSVRAALSEAMARKRVRIALFARALPLGVMFFVFLLAWGFQLGFIVAAVVSTAAGVASVWFYRLFIRAKYRATVVEETDMVPANALVQVYPPLLDGNGDEKYFIRVNGKGLAHDTLKGDGGIDTDADVVENIGEAGQQALEDLFSQGRVQPSLATWHARSMFRFGIVDTDDTRKKIVQKMRRQIFPRLKKNDGAVETAELQRKLEDYPENLRETKWRQWHVHGTEEGRLNRRGEFTVLVP